MISCHHSIASMLVVYRAGGGSAPSTRVTIQIGVCTVTASGAPPCRAFPRRLSAPRRAPASFRPLGEPESDRFRKGNPGIYMLGKPRPLGRPRGLLDQGPRTNRAPTPSGYPPKGSAPLTAPKAIRQAHIQERRNSRRTSGTPYIHRPFFATTTSCNFRGFLGGRGGVFSEPVRDSSTCGFVSGVT